MSMESNSERLPNSFTVDEGINVCPLITQGEECGGNTHHDDKVNNMRKGSLLSNNGIMPKLFLQNSRMRTLCESSSKTETVRPYCQDTSENPRFQKIRELNKNLKDLHVEQQAWSRPRHSISMDPSCKLPTTGRGIHPFLDTLQSMSSGGAHRQQQEHRLEMMENLPHRRPLIITEVAEDSSMEEVDQRSTVTPGCTNSKAFLLPAIVDEYSLLQQQAFAQPVPSRTMRRDSLYPNKYHATKRGSLGRQKSTTSNVLEKAKHDGGDSAMSWSDAEASFHADTFSHSSDSIPVKRMLFLDALQRSMASKGAIHGESSKAVDMDSSLSKVVDDDTKQIPPQPNSTSSKAQSRKHMESKKSLLSDSSGETRITSRWRRPARRQWSISDEDEYQLYISLFCTAYMEKSMTIRQRWKRACRLVGTLHYFRKQLSLVSKKKEARALTFSEIGDEAFDENNLNGSKQEVFVLRQPSVDVEEKAADGRFSLSTKVKQRMADDPLTRTSSEISLILCDLQFFPSFSSYPMEIQKQIATFGSFQSVGKRRVVVRQGHTPHNWYFITSGQGIVTETSEETGDRTTVKFITGGDSFGEDAILNRTVHAHTVIARSVMELVLLEKNYFLQAYKMTSTVDNIPQRIDVLRNMPFMKMFPWEIFMKHPAMVCQKYFKPNTVLVVDSSKSDWIYILKTGFCVVYMFIDEMTASWKDLQLTLAHPSNNIDGQSLPAVDTGPVGRRGIATCHTLYQRMSAQNIEASCLMDVPALHLTRPVRNIHHGLFLLQDTGKIRCPWPLDFFNALSRTAYPISMAANTVRCMSDKSLCSERVRKGKDGAVDEDDDHSIAPCASLMGGKRMSHVHCRSTDPNQPDDEVCSERATDFEKPPDIACGRRVYTKPSRRHGNKTDVNTDHDNKSHHRTTHGPSVPRYQSRNTQPQYSAKTPNIFVKIGVLGPGDTFISDGAEVVYFNKRFFMRMADERTLMSVREHMNVYPSTEAVKTRLRLQLAWRLYSDKVKDDLYASLTENGVRHFGTFFQTTQLNIPDPYDVVKNLDDS